MIECDERFKITWPRESANQVRRSSYAALVDFVVMRVHVIDKSNSNPAYHLAVGSAGTARDLANITVDEQIKGELLWFADNFLQIADILSTRELDMKQVCEHLGFDPTNHHNAAKCPYCTPSA